jgi:hypothetical protein
METLVQSPTTSSRTASVVGWILTGLVTAFLLFDGIAKLVKPKFVVEGTLKYGYHENVLVPLGIVLTASTILYAIPRTAVLGAILLTGYLGGAVNTHVHAAEGAFPILFPVIFGSLMWLGLYLRDPRIRALVPVTSPPRSNP